MPQDKELYAGDIFKAYERNWAAEIAYTDQNP